MSKALAAITEETLALLKITRKKSLFKKRKNYSMLHKAPLLIDACRAGAQTSLSC
jgi:hypothetical protein